MAHINGLAMVHVDFSAQFFDFIQNDPDLMASGQNWTEVWRSDPLETEITEVQTVFVGTGIAGQDQIFIGFDFVFDSINSVYEMHIYGMTGIIPSATDIRNHINVSNFVRVFLDINPFNFWFTVSGRRILITHRISTVFQSAYAGFFLPYALPDTYGYPCFIGGMTGDNTQSFVQDWRSTDERHSDFLHPFRNSANIAPANSSAYLIDPAGVWTELAATSVGTSEIDTFNRVMPHPYEHGPVPSVFANPRSDDTLRNQIEAYGGQFATLPVTLVADTLSSQVYGVLDGIIATQGANNASENVLTVDGVDHLVVQNAFRTSGDSFHAMVME